MNHSIDIADHQLACLQGGRDDSAPVVFVHGITGSVNMWPVILPPHLLDDLNWCSLSLPGHYPSVVPTRFDAGSVTPEFFSELMSAAIEQRFGDQPVHLVGWSTGGFAVLKLAADFPDRCASVMSIAGYARGHWGGSMGWLQSIARAGSVGRLTFRRLFARLAADPVRFRQSLKMLTANRSAWAQSPLTPRVVSVLYEDFRHHDYKVLGALFAGIKSFDITDSLSRITSETLIVNGESDPTIPATEARWIADAIDGSKLRILAKCGHMFFAEAQAEFTDLLVTWLQRHDLPG